MEAIKSFKANPKLKKQGYLMAGLMFFLFFIGLIAIRKAIIFFPILGSIRLLTISLQSKHEVIKIYKKHFELQLGVIASKKLIKNENFKSIKVKAKKIEIVYLDEKNTKKTIKVPKIILTEDDLETFISHLNNIETKQIPSLKTA